jgi:hypothetical protein
MDRILDLYFKGGTAARVMGAAGGLAALLAVILLLGIVARARSGLLRSVSIGCLLFSCVAVGAGVAQSFKARQAADAAASNERLGKSERIRRTAYLDAQAIAALGLETAVGPLLLALIALRVAGRRRWAEDHDTPPPGAAIPVLLFLAGLAGCGIAAYFWKGPVPGREMEDTGWKLVDLRDALDAKEWTACLTTDIDLDGGVPPQARGEWRDNQARCAKHFMPPADTEAGHMELQKLLAVRWFEDKEQRKLVQQRLDETAPKPPEGAKTATPAPPPEAKPDPAVAEMQKLAKECFQKAAHHVKAPATGVELVVSKVGKVTDAKPKGGGKENAAALKCLLKAAKPVTFAAGEERHVDLTF